MRIDQNGYNLSSRTQRNITKAEYDHLYVDMTIPYSSTTINPHYNNLRAQDKAVLSLLHPWIRPRRHKLRKLARYQM